MPREPSSLSRPAAVSASRASGGLFALLLAVAATPFGVLSVHAQSQVVPRIVTPPPAAQALRGRTDNDLLSLSVGPLLSAPTAAAGEAVFDLNIEYTESKIYNPATGKYDTVRLRSYRDATQSAVPKIPLVAPTIEIAPGETVRVTLHNQ